MDNLTFNFNPPDILLVVDSWVLTILLGIALVIFIIISSILLYHWHRFAFDHERIVIMRRIYFFGSFLLLGTALIGVIMYGLSHQYPRI